VGSVDWWIGFSDSTLNLLEQMAHDWADRTVRQPSSAAVAPYSSARRGTDDDVAVALASAYIQARVLRIRLATAHAVTMNVRRQTEPSSKQGGAFVGSEPTAAQRALAMAERAHSAAAYFEASLDRCLSDIAVLTGMEPAQARKLLEPTFSSSQLPAFGVAVPSRLPAQVVRGRSDVRSLEVSLVRDRMRASGQFPTAELAAALGGWIEPHVDASADTEHQDPVGHAKAEVGSALYRLVRQQQAAAMNYQISQLRRTEFETVLQRQRLGEASDAEVLEKHLLLLIENDRLAAAVGAFAGSWITLNAATGGQAAVAASGQLQQPPSAGGTQEP
jgi:outer membrane protein TolC